jgi:hypothetical protein
MRRRLSVTMRLMTPRVGTGRTWKVTTLALAMSPRVARGRARELAAELRQELLICDSPSLLPNDKRAVAGWSSTDPPRVSPPF